MTKLYTIDDELIFDEPDLTLKEAVKKHKANLVGADLVGADLGGIILNENKKIQLQQLIDPNPIKQPRMVISSWGKDSSEIE